MRNAPFFESGSRPLPRYERRSDSGIRPIPPVRFPVRYNERRPDIFSEYDALRRRMRDPYDDEMTTVEARRRFDERLGIDRDEEPTRVMRRPVPLPRVSPSSGLRRVDAFGVYEDAPLVGEQSLFETLHHRVEKGLMTRDEARQQFQERMARLRDAYEDPRPPAEVQRQAPARARYHVPPPPPRMEDIPWIDPNDVEEAA